jgi:hypothetical protein
MGTYSPADARAILDGLFAAHDQEGVTAAVRALSPDVEWVQYDVAHRPAEPVTARGHEEVAALLAKGLAPGMTHRLVRTVAADDSLACHIECAYPSGGKVEATYVLDVEGGRITRVVGTMVWDD